MRHRSGALEKTATAKNKDAQMNYLEYLKNNLDRLLDNIKKDSAGYASTMLHRFREQLNDVEAVKTFLIYDGRIDFTETREINESISEIRKIIHKLLEKRISWQAGLIEETIASRNTKGTYKGEFTTEVILANAYNDIFKATDEMFNKEHVECRNAWISPKEKLPEPGQEIEFIARRRLFEGDSGVRERFLGVYKQMFLNPPHCIFYAAAPGWGCEFLPKEVECWMPETPMPEEPV